ncbi:uncharacterized protein [Nicotiana sylvestris]|uniref:Uncharacterized protein LOC104248776 isoform X1 n=1 Tax=Nicotiana sylvestris TaxID=4096 RepID=A0A1U7YH05_NICSY|nr:PREDICTED: uncharacterized protein LOC104248776 isoform X1 [Nicotiana sylvestris]XP_009803396.1 PREDICTED: uncharacterized protein LOC104248776 isoform X1 [Nicotiana sylvestris]XP_009803397.1 PREDICTED: uncharacterized protein LOC104248776 isoform X1 [Nicotiana sylvestris]XP_009803398.1 PREDICTED: uncharacterized protein LOC104248776 isoform X1 [Nicotiana sylvestris]
MIATPFMPIFSLLFTLCNFSVVQPFVLFVNAYNFSLHIALELQDGNPSLKDPGSTLCSEHTVCEMRVSSVSTGRLQSFDSVQATGGKNGVDILVDGDLQELRD